MGSEENKSSSDAYEPSPTSAPPSDVEIPVETIYGDNVPIETPPVEEKTESTKESNSGKRAQSSSQTNPSQSSNSIKIGFIPFLLLMLILGGGLFVLGNKFRVNLKDGKPSIESTEYANKLPETTEDNKNSDEEEVDSEDPDNKSKPKQKRTLNFLRDLGLYKRENSYTSSELAASRLQKADKTIIWVTSEPNNEKMISVLEAIKNKSPIPIFIVTGAETSGKRIQRALDAGFSVSRLTSTLEIPYSILLIDDEVLMDISREHWIWETSQKDVINQTARWASELLKNAKLVDKRIQ
jgi:hypothetical protein